MSSGLHSPCLDKRLSLFKKGSKNNPGTRSISRVAVILGPNFVYPVHKITFSLYWIIRNNVFVNGFFRYLLISVIIFAGWFPYALPWFQSLALLPTNSFSPRLSIDSRDLNQQWKALESRHAMGAPSSQKKTQVFIATITSPCLTYFPL